MCNTKKYNSYYECKRCFYKCYQKNDMTKHMNRKILCDRVIDSFNYKDEDLTNLSLTRIQNEFIENKNLCNYCSKTFSSKINLEKHIEKTCKKKEVFINNNNNSINNTINNTIVNNINITNNIFIMKSFREEWDDSKIDDKSKILLLLADSKFTSTLENLLENEANLNVLVDNTNDSTAGLVFNENKFENMNINDIIKTSMEKLYNILKKFRQEINESTEFDIKKKSLDIEEKIIDEKYEKYKLDKNIQTNVNSFIKDIYNKKKEETMKVYNNNFTEIKISDNGY